MWQTVLCVIPFLAVCSLADNDSGKILDVILPNNVHPFSEILDKCMTNDHCAGDRVCLKHKCVDPCGIMCGPYTICHVTSHVAMCSCRLGHSGHPILGCSPTPSLSMNLGCVTNEQCPASKFCVSGVCKDPCEGLCGLNTTCSVFNHIPTCTCKEGFTGNPLQSCHQDADACTDHAHCHPHQACVHRTCVDPCAGLCGNNTLCDVTNHIPACVCKDGYNGNPFKGCKLLELKDLNPPAGECYDHYQCKTHEACVNRTCADPCMGLCGNNTLCKVTDHIPVCVCKDGYAGNPLDSCSPVKVYSSIWPPPGAGKKMFHKEARHHTCGLTWMGALDYCAGKGMRLARIESEEEEAELKELLKEHDGSWWWIGGSRGESGEFLWLGDQPMKYQRWAAGEPNNVEGQESCLMASSQDGMIILNDLRCFRKLSILCEYY